ncbi:MULTISPECIES: glycerophosphodiester phosphodiesterase [unclassified Halomonas]|uniref:glycerophosphodiester phosphodiesterase n=1 Tax=unclassified Halomonas TaxID=2609666 RepID=UPI0006D96F88|nr:MULTISPECIES: glycerophosphodiester phosphodiesterase [unclassified Halomonas]KPQ21082.1 MAG: glycerophosphoryl diester phosphodiesterase GlpQ [Halomonas sp. HL-93]SBR50527.1 glycerophosphoryl diester phosphodiesterase [Halomonas sp. HL-93]SNY96904.1 glycerophosphoryl diester phosphodiesterase [Halomonas sp. hl-4]
MQRLPLATAVSLGLFAGAATTAAIADTSPLEQQLKDLEAFQVIAHRGASGHAPESTMAAFEQAHEWGVDYLELDAQITSDGELVVFHDDTIDRTSDGEGEINDYTLEELKALDTGTWFNDENPDSADSAFEGAQILTLDELFERFGHDARYYIETKSPQLNPGLEEALVETLEEYDMVENGRVLVQSFEQDSLLKVQELNDDVPLIQLVWYYPSEEDDSRLVEWTDVTPGPAEITDEDFQEVADYAVGIGTNVIYEGEEVIDADFVKQAQDNGLPVHVYTVNETEEMERLMEWGVNGLFTNYPDRLLDLVE